MRKNSAILCLTASIVALTILILLQGMRRMDLPDHSTAAVQQMNSIYIFYKSKPAAQFDVMGQVKPGVLLTGSPEERLNSLLKQCNKKFPAAEGIVIDDINMGVADVIKFK